MAYERDYARPIISDTAPQGVHIERGMNVDVNGYRFVRITSLENGIPNGHWYSFPRRGTQISNGAPAEVISPSA